MKPDPLRLSALLQRLFRAQASEVLGKLDRDGLEAPDLTHWNGVLADAVRPLLLHHWQAGMLASQRRVAALLHKPQLRPGHHVPRRHEIERKEVMSHAERTHKTLQLQRMQPDGLQVTRAGRQGVPIDCRGLRMTAGRPFSVTKSPKKPRLAGAFDLFNPRVLDAVDAATMTFCRETNATAVGKLEDALRDLRGALKEGLEAGMAHRWITRKVRQIFADPFRAFRIVVTETSRAENGGAVMAAKASGIVRKKEWLASADACEACLDLDGEQRDLDEPFLVEGSGPYAVVQHPPLHPS